jgi:hypothetical protein
VLKIEKHEVATRRLENMADPGRGELHDEMPELWSLRLSKFLQSWRCHRISPFGRATQGALLSTSTRATAQASRLSSFVCSGRSRTFTAICECSRLDLITEIMVAGVSWVERGALA